MYSYTATPIASLVDFLAIANDNADPPLGVTRCLPFNHRKHRLSHEQLIASMQST
jgi:hypothetical protein